MKAEPKPPYNRFAVARCIATANGRFWLEPQPCASLEDGMILIDRFKAQSKAWVTLGVIGKRPGYPWATLHLWEASSHEERKKAHRRKRTIH
jgi:hypothetical protein